MAGGRLRQLTAGLPWPVISIGVVTFLVLMGFGLVPPALPLYAVHYALPSAEVALLLTSFSAGMLVFSFPGGMIADLLGFKRVALAGCVVAGLGALAAATLAALLAPDRCAVRAGDRCSAVHDRGHRRHRRPDPRQQGRARHRHLSGDRADRHVGRTGFGRDGGAAPRVEWALPGVRGCRSRRSSRVVDRAAIGASRASRRIRRRQGCLTKDDPTRRVAVKRLLTSRAAIIALVVSFATHWAVGGVRNTLVPLFGEAALGMSTVGIGWLLTGASVANVAVIRHAGQAIDAGRRAVTIWSLAGFALSVAIAAFAGAPWLLFVATLMIGATKGYAGVVPVAVITDAAHRSIYGSAIWFQRTATSLGLAIVPFTAGALADAFGFRPAFVVAACLLAAVALLAVLMPETATIDPSAKAVGLRRRRQPSTSPDMS